MPILGDIQNLTGYGPGKTVVADPTLNRGVGQGNLQKSLLTSSILLYLGICDIQTGSFFLISF